MLVGAIMSRTPVTVTRDHTVRKVARLMREKSIGSVVVVDGDGLPQGIVTDRDVAIRALDGSHGDPGSVPVDAVMSRPVFTVDEDTLMFDLLRDMASRRIRRAPVVNARGAVIGMVAMDDIILLLAAEFGNVAEVLGSASHALDEDVGSDSEE